MHTHSYRLAIVAVAILSALCFYGKNAGAQAPKKPAILYLADFVATAKQEWLNDKTKFLQRLAFIKDRCTPINPRCAPHKFRPDIQAITLEADNRKRPQMQKKLVFTTNLRNGVMIEDAVVISKGDLKVDGPINSSLVIVDGDLQLPARLFGISNSLVLLTGSCRAGLVVDRSIICCQGVLHADSLFSTTVIADSVRAGALVKACRFPKETMLDARVTEDVKFRKFGEDMAWFEYYSLRRFPLKLKHAGKGTFTVSAMDKKSDYAKSGLKVGDQIVAVRSFSSFETRLDLFEVLSRAEAMGTMKLSVIRKGKPIDITVQKSNRTAK